MKGSNRPIRLVVVIPAYKPSSKLIRLIESLPEPELPVILVVDDGSGPDYREIFERVAAIPRVQLLRHAVNLGKGAALKTAFNHALCLYPDLAGILTADADGQHHPDDIRRLAAIFCKRPTALLLGSRGFEGHVPLRSRIGNVATRWMVRALLGQRFTDTQTGLRCIPANLLPHLLQIESRGYEFELEMLIAAHRMEVPVIEEPIQTIYEAGNPSSHFNPIIDSMKIYFVLLRFGSVSLLTALLDNLIFFAAYRHTGYVLGSQILGRIFAVIFNYTMVRRSVFYSRERHQKVLPKYLGLVVVSGATSYAGIRWLIAVLRMGAVPAKLLVESALFLVNFTVQRVFIFQPQEGGRNQERRFQRFFTLIIAALLIALAAVETEGFLTSHVFAQDIWTPAGARRFARYTIAYLLVAIPLLLKFPSRFFAVMTLLMLALTALSAGVQPVVAVVFFLVSAFAFGTLLMGRRGANPLCTLLLGAGLDVFVMMLTSRLPVNNPAVWTALLAIPIVLAARSVWNGWKEWRNAAWNAALPGPKERVMAALLAFVLIAHWLVALKPEVANDALAMHLAIPMNIAANHRMTFEPGRFVWAVMPMGADWAYSIVYLLGGEYATRLLNLAMLGVVAGLMIQAARRWVEPAAAWLLAAAFAATPLVQLVTGSLFVENFLAATILGVLTAVWIFADTGDRRYLFLGMVAAGTAITTKLGAIAFLLFMLPFLAWAIGKHWKKLGPRPLRTCGLASALLLALALPTYVIAWKKTGNPIFPFENQRFHSPLLDPTVSLNDARYKIPLAWDTLYTLTFHSSLTYEGQDGSFGFQYLFIVPLAIAGLSVAAHRGAALGALAAALGGSILILSSQPNARFLYAALPLASVGFAGLLGWASERQQSLYHALLAGLLVSTLFNIGFLPSSSYYHKNFCLSHLFSPNQKDRYLEEAAPIRKIIGWQNSHHPGSGVLLASNNEIAGLSGDVYENHWHQYPVQHRLQQASSVSELLHILKAWKVGYIISRMPDVQNPLSPQVLEDFLDSCAIPEYEAGELYVARLAADCRERQRLLKPSLVARAGLHDDLDPALLFRGNWTHDRSFREPDAQTISYTDVPGAEVSILFEGSALLYVYTKAPNRGIAEVTVDGRSQGTIDLYSPQIQWQTRTDFCCFSPNTHLAVLRVTGESNPQSRGKFVDVDSFFVLP
jgi:glycosyltransferase involved in cell wall biosynthesis